MYQPELFKVIDVVLIAMTLQNLPEVSPAVHSFTPFTLIDTIFFMAWLSLNRFFDNLLSYLSTMITLRLSWCWSCYF